jgi:hypothetical protein
MQIRLVKIKLYLLGLLFVVSCPALSHADPVRMSIQPNGQGSFVMTGENVIGVQALDVELDYDSSMLQHPYVMINGGDLKQIQENLQGKLNFSIFRQVADPLLQIFVNFEEARAENTTNGIYHVSASVRSTTEWPTKAETDSPSEVSADEPTDVPADVPSPPRADKTAPTGIVPKVNPAVVPDRARGSDTTAAVARTASSPGPDRKVQAEKIVLLSRDEKSVLQRFKKYEGEKELSSFVALFGRSYGDRFVQEPAVAISDGKSPVTIRIDVQPDGAHSTAIALADATLLSKEAREKDVVITVLPNEGTWDARLVISTGREILDYPLVVAPPVNLAGTINANNFIGALHAYIGNQSPPLQKENKIYLSEYIFTANYLARLKRWQPKNSL